MFSAQTFANVFYLLILLELRVPKIRDTLSYLTLLVCLVLFNFQGPISLPPREAALLLYHTLFSLSSSFFEKFFFPLGKLF